MREAEWLTPLNTLTDGVIVLRDWIEHDIRFLVDALQDEEVSRWVPAIPWPYTEDDAKDFIRRGAVEHGGAAVTDARTGTVLGAVAMHVVNATDLIGAVGYWVARDARHQGVATRAVALVVECGFEKLGLERLELMTDVDNVASQRVAEKNGFQREGRLRSHMKTRYGRRDSYLYSLLPSDLVRE